METMVSLTEHIAESGKIPFSQTGADLSARLKDRYDVEILGLIFSKRKGEGGKSLGILSLLTDARASKNKTVKAIARLPGAEHFGVRISKQKYGKAYREFAETAAAEYMDIAGVDRADYDAIEVEITDFRARMINVLYAKAFFDVQNFMFMRVLGDKRDIVGMEESKYYFLIDDLESFNYAVKHKDALIKKIFNMMKKYDRFGVLTPDDLTISFFLKEALDHEMLSRFLMQRVL